MSFLFVHGAGDPNAEDGSFRLLDRLKPALVLPEGKCVVPLLPRPETPDGRVWTDEIVSALSALDDGATVLAHSFGGSCTLAALSAMPMELRIARLILVAVPHWGIDPDWPSSAFSLKPDYATRLEKIDSIDLVYSRDDDIVPASHFGYYLDELSTAKGHLLTGTGHTFIQGNIDVLEHLVSSGLANRSVQ